MKISLVHATRGQVERATTTVRQWASMRSGAHDVQHVLSVDTTDPAREAYVQLARTEGLTIVVHRNQTMVEAVNNGARHATGDLLVVIADGAGCPERWDEQLASLVTAPEAAIQVNDGRDGRLMTLPILTRRYYRRLGGVFLPAYHGFFAVEDLTAVARRDGVLIDARHLVFPHTPRTGDGDWWYGWTLFQQRRLSDFGRRRTWRVRLGQRRLAWYYAIRLRASRVPQRLVRDLIVRLASPLLPVPPPDRSTR